MLDRRGREQLKFFVCGSLRNPVPDDHVLTRVDWALDPGWLHEEVVGLYADRIGRPAIDPEAAVRLMLAGFLPTIVHHRRLMREVQGQFGDPLVRRVAGPSAASFVSHTHSATLGGDRFREIFRRVVQSCAAAGLAQGEVAHVDATLIRADVSFDAPAERHLDEGEAEALDEGARETRRTGKFKMVRTTDPDATMATSSRKDQLEPACKQHAPVDDSSGVVLDMDIVTGGPPTSESSSSASGRSKIHWGGGREA